MDGFAISIGEHSMQDLYQIKSRQLAGETLLSSAPVDKTDCVYITTGAAVPTGYDTVI